MSRLKVKISVKICIVMGIVGVLSLAVAWAGLSGMSAVNGKAQALGKDNLDGLTHLSELRSEVGKVEAAGLQNVANDDPAAATKLKGEIDKASKASLALIEDLGEHTGGDPAVQKALAAVKTDFQKLSGELAAGAYEPKAGDNGPLAERLAGRFDQLDGALNAYAKGLHDAGVKATQEADDAAGSRRTVLLAILGVGILAGAALAWSLIRDLVPRIRDYSAFAEKVAEGDLTARLEPQGGDALTKLAIALNTMVEKLADMTRRLQHNASTIGAGTTQILAATSQQTSSATHQSASVAETTSAVEELRATAEHAALKAEEVTREAHAAVEVGDDGARAVHDIEKGMLDIQTRVDEIARGIADLSRQAQRIADITTTVNDLADQSNLLALNATIEAAKAGEQGKGFAVVADEVRNLAEQSKQATAQVQSVLEEITQAANAAVQAAEAGTATVRSGAELASRAGTIIDQLVQTSRRTDEAAQQIAATAQQQNVGMDQIAQAMKETSQATSEFVAGAEQSRSAADDLRAVADELVHLAEAYKL